MTLHAPLIATPQRATDPATSVAPAAAAVTAERRRLLTLAASAAWVGTPAAVFAAPGGRRGGAAVGPLPRLAKGLNLSHWFEYERGQGLDLPEMQQLLAAGLDHVRIPVDPAVGGWLPERMAPPDFLAALRDAAGMAVRAGLEVVIDLHLEPSDKQRIEDSPELESGLVRLWTQMAGALVGLPADKLAFELFNEPQYYGLQRWRWPPLQRRLLAAVRALAPQHLVLLSGSGGGSFEALSGLATRTPGPVAYVFHHYEPFLFTHQGAAWLDERYTTAGLRSGLHYPPGAAADGELRLSRPHPRAAQELQDYYRSGWGQQRMHSEMQRAGQWARQRGVRLLCNEFGCIRAQVDVASRYHWLGDVRRALEAQGIGWTVWDYTDIFGITRQSAQLGHLGRRQLDSEAFAALGLSSQRMVR